MAGVRAVMELSRYYFEVLRKDDAFVLYRGRNGEDASQVLVLSPAGERPSQENLQRLEHEYSLREALNTEWAIRPIAIAWHSDRPVLVSHDPGAALLDQLLFARDRPVASERYYPQGHSTGEHSDRPRHRTLLVDGLWLRLTASPRTPGA